MTGIIGLCLQYPGDVLKIVYLAAKTIKRKKNHPVFIVS